MQASRAGSSSPAVPAAPLPGSAESLLLTGHAREVLARIVPGDPLGLRARAARRIEQRNLFLDVDRVHLRSLARVARLAVRWRGEPALDDLLAAGVDEAVEDVLGEGAGAQSGGAARTPGVPAAARALGEPLGLDPGELQRALSILNARPEEERRALRQLLVGPGAEAAAERGPAGDAGALAAARRALVAALFPDVAAQPGTLSAGGGCEPWTSDPD